MVLSIIAYSLSASAGQMLKHPLPYPALRPAAKPSARVLPVAKAFRQVAPCDPRAVSAQDRLHKPAIVLRGDADTSGLPGKQVLYPLPLVVLCSYLQPEILHERRRTISDIPGRSARPTRGRLSLTSVRRDGRAEPPPQALPPVLTHTKQRGGHESHKLLQW
jgi:hypothetical protein